MLKNSASHKSHNLNLRKPKKRIIHSRMMTVGDLRVEVQRKKMKTVRFKVFRPNIQLASSSGTSDATGTESNEATNMNVDVRVSAPVHVSDGYLRSAIESQCSWIKEQQEKLLAIPLPPDREFVTGETQYLWGKPYKLELREVTGGSKVYTTDSYTLIMHVRPGTDKSKRIKLLNEFYRAQIKEEIPKLIAKWEPIMKVSVQSWGVKNMKTRWGTCNTHERRIWLNLELAKKEISCLDYVVAHEMVHILEPSHNKRFWSFMDTFMPEWPEIRTRLNEMS